MPGDSGSEKTSICGISWLGTSIRGRLVGPPTGGRDPGWPAPPACGAKCCSIFSLMTAGSIFAHRDDCHLIRPVPAFVVIAQPLDGRSFDDRCQTNWGALSIARGAK